MQFRDELRGLLNASTLTRKEIYERSGVSTNTIATILRGEKFNRSSEIALRHVLQPQGSHNLLDALLARYCKADAHQRTILNMAVVSLWPELASEFSARTQGMPDAKKNIPFRKQSKRAS